MAEVAHKPHPVSGDGAPSLVRVTLTESKIHSGTDKEVGKSRPVRAVIDGEVRGQALAGGRGTVFQHSLAEFRSPSQHFAGGALRKTLEGHNSH
jgi:hypothetical protein